MITVIKPGTKEEQLQSLICWFKDQGYDVHVSTGAYQTVLGIIGDTAKIDTDLLEGKYLSLRTILPCFISGSMTLLTCCKRSLAVRRERLR